MYASNTLKAPCSRVAADRWGWLEVAQKERVDMFISTQYYCPTIKEEFPTFLYSLFFYNQGCDFSSKMKIPTHIQERS